MVAVCPSEGNESCQGPSVKQQMIHRAGNIICFVVFSFCIYVDFISIFERPFLHPLNYRTANNSVHIASNPTQPPADLGTAVATVTTILLSGLALGKVMQWATVPPLLGMLISGIVLRNVPVPGWDSLLVPHQWSVVLRRLAFIVILVRGSLSLDGAALKKMKGACVRLSLSPSSVEAVIIALAAKAVFGLDWLFGLLLGFVMAAVSPAVVVPAMIKIREEGYSTRSGLSSLVIAAASIDGAYAITMFSILLTVVFSPGESIWLMLLRAPLEVAIGCMIGIVTGYALQYVRPNWRFLLLCASTTALFFCCARSGFDAVGVLSALVAAFVAGEKWKKNESPLSAQASLVVLWHSIFQPLLFGLIGFELSFKLVSIGTLALGLIVLLCGAAARAAAAYVSTIGSGLCAKERIYVAVASVPKATVQAALASVALDLCKEREAEGNILPEGYKEASTVVFALAVLTILTTAPIGAVLIRVATGVLLKKEEDTMEDMNVGRKVNDGGVHLTHVE